MKPSYPLLTSRLVLRPFESGDREDLLAYMSPPEVSRYLYTDPLANRAAAKENLARKIGAVQAEDEGDMIFLAVYLPEVGRVIGDVMLHYSSRVHRQGEIGFVFHPDHHGRGFATEAARVALEIGFQGLQLHRIIARCDARNLASARVMERLGMVREAHLVENEFVYAIRQREWAANAEPSRA
ncbi:MAG: GNAT family N-acetyltransferase [Candidatus Dormibacteria bacterium]